MLWGNFLFRTTYIWGLTFVGTTNIGGQNILEQQFCGPRSQNEVRALCGSKDPPWCMRYLTDIELQS